MEAPEALRFAIALVMLLGASLSDLRSRRVGNKYWVPFLVFAAVLWLVDLAQAGPTGHLALRAGVAAATCALLYALWYTGTFGGADAKGLMVLAWLWPTLPDLAALRLTPTADSLVNGSILVLAVPVLVLSWNLARAGRHRTPRPHPLALLLGIPMDLDRAERRHVWPLQAVDGQGRLRWRFWHRPSAPLEETYRLLRQQGVKRVWVTPKVPFMVPLALGLAVLPLTGNLALRAALLLLG